MFFSGERICLLTGANSGIGKAAACALAGLGVTLLLVSRNRSRGQRTIQEIKSSTGNEKIFLFIADLSSQLSIFNLANEIKSKFSRIDILINNAGVYFSNRHLTVDGIEATFAVNYLSRFLLTNLLIDQVKQSFQGRIINVAGEFHRKGEIEFSDLNKNRCYSAGCAVAQSKLADILFTYSLSRKLKGTNVTVNCMHPGMVATNIIYSDPDATAMVKIIYLIASRFFSSPEKGAETLLYLASSPEVSNITGSYFINKKVVASSPATYDDQISERLWTESTKLTSEYLQKDKSCY